MKRILSFIILLVSISCHHCYARLGDSDVSEPLDGFHSNLFLHNPFYQNLLSLSNALDKDPRGPPSNQNGKLNLRLSKLLFESSNGQQQQQQGPPNGMPPNFQNGQQGPPNGFQGPPPNGQQGPPNGFQGPPQNGGPFNSAGLPNGPQQGMLPPPGNGSFILPPPPPNMPNQTLAYKGCKGTTVMSNIDVDKLLGKWYALGSWLANNMTISNITCVKQTVSMNGTNVAVSVLTTFSNFPTTNGTVTFSKQAFLNGMSGIKIIDTDYTNFVIWLNCNGGVESVSVSVRSANSTYFDPSVFDRMAKDLNNLVGVPAWQVPRIGRTGCSQLN